MKNKRKKKNKLFLLLLIILGISVGFALLSTTLNITGTAGVNKNIWDIHWDQDSIQVTENSVAAETPTVTENGQKLSYEVTLELPGDFYEFTIDAVNAGTIDGMISIDGLNPTITYADGSPATLPSDIHYSVTYADGSPVEQYHKLAKRVDANTPTREKFKIRIEFDKEATSPIGEDKIYKINDDVPYTQGDERAKDRENDDDTADDFFFDGENFITNVDSYTGIYFKFPKNYENMSYVLYYDLDNDINYIGPYDGEQACINYKLELINAGVEEDSWDKNKWPTAEEFREDAMEHIRCTPQNASEMCMRRNNKEVCIKQDEIENWDCNYNSETGKCDNTNGFTAKLSDTCISMGLDLVLIVDLAEEKELIGTNKELVEGEDIFDALMDQERIMILQVVLPTRLIQPLIFSDTKYASCIIDEYVTSETFSPEAGRNYRCEKNSN